MLLIDKHENVQAASGSSGDRDSCAVGGLRQGIQNRWQENVLGLLGLRRIPAHAFNEDAKAYEDFEAKKEEEREDGEHPANGDDEAVPLPSLLMPSHPRGEHKSLQSGSN